MYFYLADSLNWCAIELYVAIFCGSASALRSIIRRFFPRLLGSYGASGATPYRIERSGNTNTKDNGDSTAHKEAGSSLHPLSHLSGNKGTTRTAISGYTEIESDNKSRNTSEDEIIGLRDIHMRRDIRVDVTRNSSTGI